MKFVILGSGFGLYGYLPALAEEGISICLPENYKDKFIGRRELQRYEGNISWFHDINCAMQEASGAVLARRPSEQPEMAARLVQLKNIKYLLLEKPLAVTPEQSQELLDMLRKTSSRFRIAYLFVYTRWCSVLKKLIQDAEIQEIHISWDFMAHHFKHHLDTWKRHNSQGGGAIRFYGIQAIALMASLGYNSVNSSISEGGRDQPSYWQAIFVREGCPTIQWSMDSYASQEVFSIVTISPNGRKTCYIDTTPFAQNDLLDTRVEPLTRHIRSLFTCAASDDQYFEWYKNTAKLHGMVEAVNTQHVARSL